MGHRRRLLLVGRQLLRGVEQGAVAPHLSSAQEPFCYQTQRKYEKQEFSKQRNKYEKDMSELRKQWYQEVSERRARAAAAAKKQDAATSKRKEETKLRKLQAKKTITEEHIAAQLELQRVKEEEKQEAARRRGLREHVLNEMRTARVEWLLERSKDWIREDELDARIEEALLHPVALYN